MGIVDICRVALFSITAILFAVNGVYNLYFGRKAFQEVTYCCGKRKYLSPEDTLNHTVRILVISCVISTAFALLALRLIEVNKVEAQLMLNYCLTVFVCLAFDISLLMVSAIPLAFGKLEPVRKVLQNEGWESPRFQSWEVSTVSKGGKTVPSNLRTLCSICNLGKSDKYDENGLN